MQRILAIAFLLGSACGTGDDGPIGWGSGGKADSVQWPERIWNKGDIYLIRDIGLWHGLEFGKTKKMAQVWLQLRAAAAELAANTPIRLHLVDEPPAHGEFRRFKGRFEGSGTSPLGTEVYDESSDIEAGPGAVRHELGHLVGLNHTHQRVDRDEHIVVHRSHLDPNLSNDHIDSQIVRKAKRRCHVGPYDTNSIMHYSSDSAAAKASCATFSRRDPDRAFDPGECVGPSDVDRWIKQEDRYTEWNYATISALYCNKQLCENKQLNKDNCASEERCSAPRVVELLDRVRQWDLSAEGQAWRARYPESFCGAL